MNDIVEVANNSNPEWTSYRYGSDRDAEHQADNWTALGIRFATDGTRWSDVRQGDRTVRVRGYDSGQVGVAEQDREGNRRVWDRDEINSTLDRHGLRWWRR